MKIGFIYSGHAKTVHSGILRYERALIKHLQQQHEVHVLEYRVPRLLTEQWSQYLRIARPLAIFRERRFIKKHALDLLVVQGAGYPEPRSLFLYPRTKVLLVQHGYPETKGMRFFTRAYMQTIGRRVFRRCDRVIAISEFTKSKIAHLVPKGRLRLIHSSAIDLKIFYERDDKEALREKYHVSGNVLSAVGRLVPWKNFATLIHAMPKIDATLLLVGDGPDRASLGALAKKLGVGDKVRFLGFVPEDSTVNEVFNVSDVSVLPSVAEGLGLTPLEAMATRTAVVATRVGGLADIIHDNESALVVLRPYDADAFAQKINALLNDRALRRRIAEYGYQMVLEKFNTTVMLRKIDEVIKELT